MWATFLHLSIGNFFIGLLEAVVVAWRITLRGKRLVGWLVGADLLIHFNGGSLPV